MPALMAVNAGFGLGGLWFGFLFDTLILPYVVYSFDYVFLSVGTGSRECW
jgi:hypothetical protein